VIISNPHVPVWMRCKVLPVTFAIT
jgi:hypothetical protein